MIQAILTDIEGTTSSIRFVHDTLFPYARKHMATFLREHASEPAVREQLDAVSEEAGTPLCLDMAIQTLCDWIDADRKSTPLKALQGMIWEHGYRDGELIGHVYPDAVEAMRMWHAHGLRLAIYSSGSVQAQKLIFGHTAYGDLTPLFTDFFDTRIGHKRESQAYQNIASAMAMPATDILFLSDVEEELDAAAAVGMATCQLIRPDEGIPGSGHPKAVDFSGIVIPE